MESTKPHERKRDETSPHGSERIKPSRVCERPKRDGAPGGTGAIADSPGLDTLEGRRTSREAGSQISISGRRRDGSLKEG